MMIHTPILHAIFARPEILGIQIPTNDKIYSEAKYDANCEVKKRITDDDIYSAIHTIDEHSEVVTSDAIAKLIGVKISTVRSRLLLMHKHDKLRKIESKSVKGNYMCFVWAIR